MIGAVGAWLAIALAAPGAIAPSGTATGIAAQAERAPPLSDDPAPDETVGASALGRALQQTAPADQIEDLDMALARLPRPTRFRGMVQCYRGWALGELDRETEANDAFEECYRLRPDDSYALWAVSSASVARGETRRGARLLIAAIKADPAPLTNYSRAAMSGLLAQLSYAREDSVRAELFKTAMAAGYGRDDPAWASAHALDAISTLVAAGDRDGAVRMLPQILVPRMGLALLIDRRYADIWPDVEAWAGGDLAAQRDAYVTATRAAYTVDPTLERLRAHVAALEAAGRDDEAIVLLKRAIDDRAGWDSDRYEIIMVAVRLAALYQHAGRSQEALKLLSDMRAAVPIAEFPMAANLLPNLVRLMIDSDRHADALAIIDGKRPSDEEAAPFYVALRACALDGLGRTSDAARERERVASAYSANEQAQMIVATCGSREDRRSFALQQFRSELSRSEALIEWQANRTRSGATAEVGDPATLYRALNDDPAIGAEAARLGRVLPPSYAAALNGWGERADR